MMAKVYSFFLFAAAAACFLSTLAISNAAPDFIIQGRVYCDTCRAGFETNVTKYIEGTPLRKKNNIYIFFNRERVYSSPLFNKSIESDTPNPHRLTPHES